MPYNIDWSVPQRQSRSAIFIAVVNALKEVIKFIWPLAILYLLRGKSSSVGFSEMIFLALPVLAIGNAVIAFLLFRFHISDGHLHIRSGFLFKKNITLPLEKIQAVHINQHWMHQMFNVVKLAFDSSGSEKMEVKILAIDRYRAEALRSFIMGEKQAPVETHSEQALPGNHSIITLNNNDLLKLCISANHIKAFFILAAFLFSAFQNFIQVGGDDARGIWKQLNEMAGSNLVQTIIILVIAALVLSLLVSVAGVLMRYYGFRIAQSEKGYQVRSGLLELKEKLVPFSKVQYISWQANWVRRQMNLYLLQFHTTGANEDVAEKQQIKVPITQTAYIEQLCRFYHDLLPENEYTALHISSRYVFRRTLLTGILPAVAIAATGWLLGYEYALLALLIIPVTYFQCWLFRKKFRAVATEGAIQLAKGVYGIKGVILQWYKVQQVGWQQTIYQRKHRLATVKLYTAGGVITIPYIPLEQAMRIGNYALYKVESSSKSWM